MNFSIFTTPETSLRNSYLLFYMSRHEAPHMEMSLARVIGQFAAFDPKIHTLSRACHEGNEELVEFIMKRPFEIIPAVEACIAADQGRILKRYFARLLHRSVIFSFLLSSVNRDAHKCFSVIADQMPPETLTRVIPRILQKGCLKIMKYSLIRERRIILHNTCDYVCRHGDEASMKTMMHFIDRSSWPMYANFAESYGNMKVANFLRQQ